jgi:SWI/SNF-related matrix-associated actin-dependent regulator of chromatin subfamily B protein 1
MTAPTQTSSRNTPVANSMPPPPSPAIPSRSTPNAPASVEASPRPPATPTPALQIPKQWQYKSDGSLDAPWPAPAHSQNVRFLRESP